MRKFDRKKSLQQLEGKDWEAPAFNSYLVTECHRLRKLPFQDFTPENLRILIGQQIGLPYLVPMALELLQEDPFTKGDYYHGDLLAMVLRVEQSFWHQFPDLRKQAAAITEKAFSSLPKPGESGHKTTRESLHDAHKVFLQSDPATT